VSVRTVARRLKDPVFLDRIAELRLEAQERAIALLGIGTAQAIETITELMGREYSPAIRLRAAVAFATLAAQARSRAGDGLHVPGLLIDVQPVDYREVVSALAPVDQEVEG
jgi:HEAT repeat protein